MGLNIENEYINRFYHWFSNRFRDEVYRKMGVDHMAGLVENLDQDLVLIINKQRDRLEVESNYFADKRAEFALIEIGIRFERYLRGI